MGEETFSGVPYGEKRKVPRAALIIILIASIASSSTMVSVLQAGRVTCLIDIVKRSSPISCCSAFDSDRCFDPRRLLVAGASSCQCLGWMTLTNG